MKDTIYRDDAINAFKSLPTIEGLGLQPLITVDDAIKILNCLPSARPEIIRCKDCKHYWIHKCMDSMPIEICDLEQTLYDAEHDFCSLAERRVNGCL